MSEQSKFLSDIKNEDGKIDVFEDSFNPVEEEISTDNPEDNREARRAKKALREERESGREVANKLAETTQLLKEIKEVKTVAENPSEALKAIEKIYGTDTPEKLAATELLKSALVGVKEEAKAEAIAAFRAEREAEAQAVNKESKTLDVMLEDLEDEYGIDLTSDQAKPTRDGFLTTLERLSPKDSDGEIVAYADPHAVWEVYQNRSRRTENRAKDIANRSMSTSTTTDSKIKNDSDYRWLRENGII